jgi:hypothetical protein
MDKVRKPSISVCYTASSEPYSIYLTFYVHPKKGLTVRTYEKGIKSPSRNLETFQLEKLEHSC